MRSLPSKLYIVVAILLVLTIVIYQVDQSAESHGKIDPIGRVSTSTVGAFQKGWISTQRFFSGLFRPLVRARSLDKENISLRNELIKLRPLCIRNNELETENRSLRSLLKLEQVSSYPTVCASVIGRNPSNWFDTILVDRGTVDGVQPEAIVMTPEGVVGRVYECTGHTSKVLLLTDPQGGVGGMIQRTRQPGVVEGNHTPFLKLNLLPKDADIKKGDIIITSGLGKIFPQGLPVGTVIHVGTDAYAGSKAADLKPAVDPTRVERVLIMMTGAH